MFGEEGLGEITCVCGLSKHPGSFHRDVAFPTRADLAEFNCAGRHPSSERKTLPAPPPRFFLCRPAKPTLKGSGALGGLT